MAKRSARPLRAEGMPRAGTGNLSAAPTSESKSASSESTPSESAAA